MLYWNVPGTDPYANLALEEYLLKHTPAGEDVFLLWQNANTVVIGRYQNTTEEVDTVYARENGITVVRRDTGGGAVYHDLGNVNFTFITDCTDPKTLDFSLFSQRMVRALRSVGFDVQISGRNDMTLAGRKFSGSAQTMYNGRVLHHGTLLFSTDLERMQRVLTVSQEKLASKGVASVRSRVTNLSEHLSVPMDVDVFKSRLLAHFTGNSPAREVTLTDSDRAAIEHLRQKYADPNWVYGRSPGYTIRKGKRFPSGKVDVFLDVGKQGVIETITFRGDFFGSRDISELEQRLTGVPLRAGTLETVLQSIGVDQYISGVSAGELTDLLLS